jgi:Permuted papain-like amidase enzyme, YaeF/YiiX, C92 family
MIFQMLTLVTTSLILTSCATSVTNDRQANGSSIRIPSVRLQSNALNPRNGGQLISTDQLKIGDIILSAENGINSVAVRIWTLASVSHASIYVGNNEIVEAVGEGVRIRNVAKLLEDESTIVAIRHPNVSPANSVALAEFMKSQVGKKYNYMGIMLQAPFSLERRACELPLVPDLVRDYCIRGVAAIQLGLSDNDNFFCSQLVLEAYNNAGLPLTNADPRLFNPADLLHMREGDVTSVKIRQTLQYLGHLKAPPDQITQQ